MVIAAGLCAMVFVGILASAAPWLAPEGIFEFTAREPKNRNPAEPSFPPRGDPASPSGDAGAADRPPPVI